MIAESCAFLLISLLACIFLFTGGQTLWFWAKIISCKYEEKRRPWSYSLVITPCDFGQERSCEFQSKYLWFSVENWLCETYFLVELITLWKQYEWIPHKNLGTLKLCETALIFELSPDVCFIRVLSVNINFLRLFCWLHKIFRPLIICRILEYGSHQKMQPFQQVLWDRCSAVKSIQPPVWQPI